MSGPSIDPRWRGGDADSWTGDSKAPEAPVEPIRRPSLNPDEFVRPREAPRRPTVHQGRGGNAAQTAVTVMLQMVKMSFVAAWKMFTFMFRMLWR